MEKWEIKMGYYVSMNVNLTIPADKVADCLKAINDLHTTDHREEMSGGSFQGGQQTAWHYSWVSHPPEGGFPNLVAAFDEWRYSAAETDLGDVEIQYFQGEKWGNDEVLFNAIAPFVNEGRIEVTGEDNDRWKYEFDGETFSRFDGEYVYEDEEPDKDELAAQLLRAYGLPATNENVADCLNLIQDKWRHWIDEKKS
jgi:hypothetical protein